MTRGGFGECDVDASLFNNPGLQLPARASTTQELDVDALVIVRYRHQEGCQATCALISVKFEGREVVSAPPMQAGE